MLANLGRREDAVEELNAASALPSGDAVDCEALGFAAFRLGEHAIAEDFYSRVVDLAPNDATAWYNLAASLRNIGRLDDAERACERCLSLDPGLAQAALMRSNLRRQTADRNHVSDLKHRRTLTRSNPGAQIFLSYALGKELDDLGSFDEAFAHFSAGARLRRLGMQYDVELDIEKLARIRQLYEGARFASSGRQTPGPYAFVLGLPRSGTTLIERVLTGHPQVRSNGETDNFSAALMEGAAKSGVDVFDRASRADQSAVGRFYVRRAGHAAPGQVIVEKLPLNYLYVGAIRLSLPAARIVLVKRSPADNCFAMYSTLFGSGYPFSYDLKEIARYFRAYQDLMAHWKNTISHELLEISYEAFTAAPSRLGADLARHVGVEWRDSMVRVENNASASATESAAQVRQPIYRKSVGRWRNYASLLAPLIDALAAEGIDPETN
jgi:tetratricopeptide (TPR) repeat protein